MARLFVRNFRKLRSSVPVLPDSMEDEDRVAGMLAKLLDGCPGVVALQGAKLVGYRAGWWSIIFGKPSGKALIARNGATGQSINLKPTSIEQCIVWQQDIGQRMAAAFMHQPCLRMTVKRRKSGSGMASACTVSMRFVRPSHQGVLCPVT